MTGTFFGTVEERGTYKIAGNTLTIQWRGERKGSTSWTLERDAIVSDETGNRYVKQESHDSQPEASQPKAQVRSLNGEGAQKFLDDWYQFEFGSTLLGLAGELKVKTPLAAQASRAAIVVSSMGDARENWLEAHITFSAVPIEKRSVQVSADEVVRRAMLSPEEAVHLAIKEGRLSLYSGPGLADFKYEGGRWFLHRVVASGLPSWDRSNEWMVGEDWNLAFQERHLTAR